MTKVSIIVPLYNVAPYVEKCMESIAAQGHSDLEVIFVDDCGTDTTMEMVGEYLASNPFPEHRTIRHERNRGLSAARNTGLDASIGDYVFFLDSDDEITTDCISSLVNAAEETGSDVVVGSHVERAEDGKETASGLEEMETGDPLEAYSKGFWPVMAWNKLCRRSFLLDNGIRFVEGLLHEDVPWSFHVAAKARKISTIGRPTYIYNLRRQSIMTSLSIEKDVAIYLKAFGVIKDLIEIEGLRSDRWAYNLVEGKKCGILYSLLQCGCKDLYRKYYPLFRAQNHISPLDACKEGLIGLKYFSRDFHYCLPMNLGRLYKHCFFLLVYKLRGRRIEGAVWE